LITLRIDMHVHTRHSDSTGSVGDVIRVARRRGMDGLAITDHDTLAGVEEALATDSGLIVVPGEEVSTDQGHVLALGIGRRVPGGLPAGEAIRRVKAQGGLVVIPHMSGFPVPFASRFRESDLSALPVDGLEVFSAISILGRHFLTKNMKLAERFGLAVLAGSDSHFPETVGDAYTVVEAESRDIRDILEAVRLGRTKIGCQPSRLWFKMNMIVTVLSQFLRGPRVERGNKSSVIAGVNNFGSYCARS